MTLEYSAFRPHDFQFWEIALRHSTISHLDLRDWMEEACLRSKLHWASMAAEARMRPCQWDWSRRTTWAATRPPIDWPPMKIGMEGPPAYLARTSPANWTQSSTWQARNKVPHYKLSAFKRGFRGFQTPCGQRKGTCMPQQAKDINFQGLMVPLEKLMIPLEKQAHSTRHTWLSLVPTPTDWKLRSFKFIQPVSTNFIRCQFLWTYQTSWPFPEIQQWAGTLGDSTHNQKQYRIPFWKVVG